MSLTVAARARLPRPPLDLRRRRRPSEIAIQAVLFGCGLVSVATTAAIVFTLLREGLQFFADFNALDFLTGRKWSPNGDPQLFGVLPLVAGTLLVSVIALAVALPLGLGAATYLSEYARPGLRRVLKPVLELLAGVPTIVFGYFALTFFTPVVLRDLLGMEVQVFNALSAGIVMGFMVLPTIASVAEDAMAAVPSALREGAFGLGASKLQVSTRVVFPAALSGIVAAIVLGVSRAIGETMIVLVAAGQQPQLGLDPRQPLETMTAFIAATAKGDVPTGSIGFLAIFAVGAALFLLTLVANAISISFVRRYRQVYE